MNDPTFAARALKILSGIEEGKETGWTSTLALAQVFSHLKTRGRYDVVDRFYDYLEGSPIGVTETTLDDLAEARKIREEQGQSWSAWDDLVLAAQMKRLGVDEIYSNDADFDRMKGTKRIF